MHERARTTLALATAGAGVVHLVVAREHGHDDPLLGAAFVAVGVVMVVAAHRLAVGAALGRLFAGVVCLATAVAYAAVHSGVADVGHHGVDALGLATTGTEIAVAVATLARGSRRGIAVACVLALLVAAPPVAVLATSDDRPLACVQPNRYMTLYAEELQRERGEIRIGWGTTPGSASLPGPLIEMVEGDCIAIQVVNDVERATLEELWVREHGTQPMATDPIGISLHVHGVKYRPSSDGTVQNNSFVPPGQTRTFIWYAAPRVTVGGRIVSQGTAGYWWYHDHIAGTDHGTGGLKAGLFGGLIVRRPGDIKPDRTYTVAFGPDTTINFKKYPDTFTCEPPTPSPSCLVAKHGERVEFLVVVVGDNFHTFHLHAHTWADNRTGMLTSQADEARLIDAKTVGPSESMGFQVIAGEDVGPGIWMMHCHVQDHSDRGMATFFNVLDAQGNSAVSGAPPMAEHVHG